MSSLVFPHMPLRSVHQHLLIVSLVIAAHAGIIWLLESGLQTRPAPEVIAPSVVTVGLVAAQPSVPAPVPSPPAPPPVAQPARQPAPQRAPAPRPAPPTPAPLALPIPSPVETVNWNDSSLAQSESVTTVADPTAMASDAATSPGSAGQSPASTVGALVGAPAAPQLQLPSAAASYLNNPPPRYPPMSRRLGEQGKVIVRARIEVDGSASQAEINTSSGYTRLDQTALQTVLSWRYVPGTRNGVPEAMWFHIPIHFVLE